MPSVTRKQHNLMEFVEHDPRKARAEGIKVPQKVAREYVAADQGKAERTARALERRR